MSKSVLETASGMRVWELLWFLSDYALRWEISRMKINITEIPDFLMSAVEYREER